MKIAVVNDSGVRVNRRKVQGIVRFFMEKAARLVSPNSVARHCVARRADLAWGDITLVLSNDDGIHAVNRAFLNHDYPTDVISFSYSSIPGESGAVAGEIVVNVELARRLGKRFGGETRELALYMAHGCDHLAGADDATVPQRRCMRSRELRWVKEAEEQGLLCRMLG